MCVCVSVIVKRLNVCLSEGQLGSPSQRTAPGAMPEVPNKSFFRRAVTVDSLPPIGQQEGSLHGMGPCWQKGEDQDGIWQRLYVLVGVRVCMCV